MIIENVNDYRNLPTIVSVLARAMVASNTSAALSASYTIK